MKTFKFLTQYKHPFVEQSDMSITMFPVFGDIPVPPSIVQDNHKVFFKLGWIAQREGMEVYECPYTAEDYKRLWEYGWTESYHNRPTDEELYLLGWDSARSGYPIHSNPHQTETHNHVMWNCGWNDFVNQH
jgi:hypothetical protein